MSHRNGPTPLVDSGIAIVDAEVVEERQHLHGECLVEFEEADVTDGEARFAKGLLGGRHGTKAHNLRLDTGEREAHHTHLGAQAEFLSRIRTRDNARGRAIVEAR